MRAAVGALALVLAATGLAACSRAPETGAGSSVQAGCAADLTQPSGEPGAAPVLATFDMSTGPGAEGHDHSVIVYADGWIAEYQAGLTPTPGGRMRPPTQEADLTLWRAGHLSPCELENVRTRLARVLGPDVDFGVGLIDDARSSAFEQHLDATPVLVSIEGFHYEPGDLTRAQRRAREDLDALWTQVREAADMTDPLPITRLRVTWYGSEAPALLGVQGSECAEVADVTQDTVDELLERGTDETARVVVIPPGVAGCR